MQLMPSQREIEQAFQAFSNEAFRRADELATARAMASREWELRGAALAIQTDESPEIAISGPAGTGKSLGTLVKFNREAWEYAGSRMLIVRKVRADLAFSALVTLEKFILGEDNPICTNVRREYRRVYHYPNGSEVVIAGMDRPTAVMSSEWDKIYVQEGVELSEDEFEALTTRLRSGVIPYQQIIMDMNPDVPHHWILQRRDRGALKFYESRHEDNPAYWDGEGWTPEGERYVLGTLERLTGVRYQRLRLGKWVVAEGAIYEDWNAATHVMSYERLLEMGVFLREKAS